MALIGCILLGICCGLLGTFIVVRQFALVGDTLAHAVLPGIALGYLSGPWIIIGAGLAGFLTTVLIEWIQKHSRIKSDAAIGIVFTSLFALGVVMVSQMKGSVHLDADCILFGNIAEVNMIQAAVVLGLTIFLSLIFYKELLVSSFDPILARSIGIRAGLVHYGKMAWLSVIVVTAFEAVGSVIVIAMLIIPGATALLLSDRLRVALLLSLVHALLSSVIGYHLALWLNSNIPAAMVVAGLLLFGLAWLFSPSQGIIPVWMARRDFSERIALSRSGRE
ncbi:UNVERIFIED_CONTAM: hypothetical protein GTU68_046147 [Idotea baltica]|nr:hypothetical protein [Idotea baltica]